MCASEIKVVRTLDKANSKILEFNFTSVFFFISIGKLFYTKISYNWQSILQLKEFFLSLPIRRCDVFYSYLYIALRRKEAILTQSSLLCESSDKFAPKREHLSSNNEAILTCWPLQNIFFTFYRRDSSNFKLLNCLDRISFMR